MIDYTVEVRNRFKGLDLIDRVPDELWNEVHADMTEVTQHVYLQDVSPQMQCTGLYNVQRSGADTICKMTRPESYPASRSFPMSQLFASGGQSIGASASVLPMNIQA